MLALLSDDELQGRIPDTLPVLTRNTPRTHDELLERIRHIRETGRSYSAEDQYEGVSSQGIAVRDPDSREVIGIAVSYPTPYGTPELKDRIGSLLDEMKRELERHSG